MTEADIAALRSELGRPPRGVLAVAYRCDHDLPAVVQTAPRLPDGTPFPTLYYLCCTALTAAVSRMESAGVMREMTARLADDPDLADAYRRAHETYLATRNALGDLGTASPRAECRTGSSACTCWSRTRSPSGAGSTRWGTRRSTDSVSSGATDRRVPG